MKKSRRALYLKNFTKLLFLLCLFSLVVMFYFAIRVRAAESKTSDDKMFTVHMVKEGETLFDIADQYADPVHYESYARYVKEVCFTNHLESDKIHAGQSLFVPYYAPAHK